MSLTSQKTNNIENSFYTEYDWYKRIFLEKIQNASNEFFQGLFEFRLLSVSENINILFQGEDYFVTKIKVDKSHDVFFRASESTIESMLLEVLGEPKKKFDMAKITELEAKIVTSFNEYLYSSFEGELLAPSGAKRKNMDIINLTFFVRSKNTKQGGKYILSLPKVLLSPQNVELGQPKFEATDFKESLIDVSIKAGRTKFPVKDLKHLEKEDIVIFQDSDISKMKVIYKDYEKTFRISPNPGLITSVDNDNNDYNSGGIDMEDKNLSSNLWDNIQVEMGAEFDKVKISLGELKNIEQGLVVDISSVYDNKISLKVENRKIAEGELVIINDRYGVRIDEVFAPERVEEDVSQMSHEQEPVEQEFVQESAAPSDGDEEFDYSDFELDDEDI